MKDEILIEEGIVLSVENGVAEVSLSKSDSCHSCSAKLICKPKDDDFKILKVFDPFGALPGDTVKISVHGSDILKASLMLYGLPLIILLIGTFLGLSIFSGYPQVELFSFLFGLGLTSLYYLYSFLSSKNRNKENIPKIVFLKRNM